MSPRHSPKASSHNSSWIMRRSPTNILKGRLLYLPSPGPPFPLQRCLFQTRPRPSSSRRSTTTTTVVIVTVTVTKAKHARKALSARKATSPSGVVCRHSRVPKTSSRISRRIMRTRKEHSHTTTRETPMGGRRSNSTRAYLPRYPSRILNGCINA